MNSKQNIRTMSIFEHMRKNNSRELLFFEEQSLQLKAIIAVDSIVLGPANAAAKFYNYKNEDEAISDALDIAYYNSLRAALLRRSMGGASIILMGNPSKLKSEMYFRALGVFLNRWNGKLYMSSGKGISYQDLHDVKRESNYILGMEESHGGLGKIYVNRAKGLIKGLKAIVKYKLKTNSLKGLKIVVQGIGDLGSEFVKQLIKEEAEITITDKIYDRIKVIRDEVSNVKIEKPENIYHTECDIFCSCAAERMIGTEELMQLKCKILTGGTNQLLKNQNDTQLLKQNNILYVPGYILNGGDIIQMSNELEGYGYEKLENELEDIYRNTLELLNESDETGTMLCELAIKKAEEYVTKVSAIKLLK
jgi:leucine dehydrogenase